MDKIIDGLILKIFLKDEEIREGRNQHLCFRKNM